MDQLCGVKERRITFASVREIGNLYSKMFFRLLRECVVGHS